MTDSLPSAESCPLDPHTASWSMLSGMSTYYNAFDISPVPAPGPDTQPPEVYRGIYGMPMSHSADSCALHSQRGLRAQPARRPAFGL